MPKYAKGKNQFRLKNLEHAFLLVIPNLMYYVKFHSLLVMLILIYNVYNFISVTCNTPRLFRSDTNFDLFQM